MNGQGNDGAGENGGMGGLARKGWSDDGLELMRQARKSCLYWGSRHENHSSFY